MTNIAIVETVRTEAAPKLIGRCQMCNGKMIAKCGDFKIWHWAHEVNNDNCQGKIMSAWHYEWQQRFDAELREVPTLNNTRADILREDEAVSIEFQNTAFDFDYIQKKEKSTPTVLWVVNLRQQKENEQITIKNNNIEYRQPKEILQYIGNLFLDFETNKIIKVKRITKYYDKTAIYNGLVFVIEYELMTYDEFINYFLTNKF
jgi:competence CoiA-like predicted nuclease